MLSISPINKSTNYSSIQSFQGRHLPKHFSAMMNYLYKNTSKNYSDYFENLNTIRVSTKLKSGEEISGIVNFLNGRYQGLVMDEGFEHLKNKFMKTVLEKYAKRVARPELQEKLTCIRNK